MTELLSLADIYVDKFEDDKCFKNIMGDIDFEEVDPVTNPVRYGRREVRKLRDQLSDLISDFAFDNINQIEAIKFESLILQKLEAWRLEFLKLKLKIEKEIALEQEEKRSACISKWENITSNMSDNNIDLSILEWSEVDMPKDKDKEAEKVGNYLDNSMSPTRTLYPDNFVGRKTTGANIESNNSICRQV